MEFHAAAKRVTDAGFAGAAAERAWWTREYAEAEGNIGGTWRPDDAASLRTFVDETLEREAALFDERLAQGRIVEGHGDLHAKHIYVLGSRPEDLVIVDCVEFSEWFHFRYLDVGYDLAFIAMDLEARGRRDLGDEVAGRYLAATGDETLGVLQPIHRAFRAFVRGKVESIGANDPGIPAADRAVLAESASRYFRLASTYAARRREPVLIVMCGASGTGKSLVGGVLAGRIGAAMVSTDAVRSVIAEQRGLPVTMWQEYEAAAYSPEMNRDVYEEMRRRAGAHLRAGRPAILDGTHRRATDREAALAVARELGVPSILVELKVSDDAALARLVNRQRMRG
ncbi:MAG: AAA family ATPase, partial [Dehalococcoidia bacterium]